MTQEFYVDDGQLTIYLVFTFLSILVSLVGYCIYQHTGKMATRDYHRYLKFYIEVGDMMETES